jgi:hypothetical protein
MPLEPEALTNINKFLCFDYRVISKIQNQKTRYCHKCGTLVKLKEYKNPKSPKNYTPKNKEMLRMRGFCYYYLEEKF